VISHEKPAGHFTDISTLPGHLSAGHAVPIEILNILAALSGHLVALAASGFRLAVDWAPPGFGGCLHHGRLAEVFF